ncbi:helix-turn-helix domain-containing protein (plasmid) [Streptomyces goshikiensis]|uniref:helix-turn-helix transcriptional regulator n=1 Tax=Streptomyces goshikiensis TaxID=1942 RepID=UPI0038668170|nr:helix-turn-helix domain-containing protein [Streptomyces goshikiensis]
MSKIHALLEGQAPRAAQLPEPTERERLRRVQGLTQAQVAEAIGVTRGAVSAWEAGRYEPRGDARVQYAELLRLIAERHPAPDGGDSP